jgi:hypothetical protein
MPSRETWTCPVCGWTWTFPVGTVRHALSYIIGHASPCMVDHPAEWAALTDDELAGEGGDAQARSLGGLADGE